MINLSFHGACREVTGSCNLVEYNNTKFLVDCGIFQGEDYSQEKNLMPFDFPVKELKYFFLTHAHVDHCGRLPKLYRDGFRGKVYATSATRDLAEIMLMDAAHIIAMEASKKGIKKLYEESDVVEVMRLFETVDYDYKKEIAKDLTVTFHDAGHILGSASLEFDIVDDGKSKKVIFSGDLGNSPSPVIRDCEFIAGADAVIMESTYAGATHESREEGRTKLRQAILETISDHGVLIIPIFVLEKSQEILFEINYLRESGLLPKVPMFLDSPLAIRAVEIYRRYEKLYNKRAQAMIKAGDDLFNFPGLKYTQTKDESKTINPVPAPKIILASSGMCVGGRIPIHLKLNLGNPSTTVLLVAYQAPGTLGRRLFNGEKVVTINEEEVEINGKIKAINSYSSHADEPALINWLEHISHPVPKTIFVNHGEEEKSLILAEKLAKEFNNQVIVPELSKVYSI